MISSEEITLLKQHLARIQGDLDEAINIISETLYGLRTPINGLDEAIFRVHQTSLALERLREGISDIDGK